MANEATSGQVRDVQRSVDQVNAVVQQVSLQVAQVSQRGEETADRLLKLAADFQTFVIDAQKTANVQRAETRIGVVEAQIEHQFGHHNVVRRSATGVMQAFDVGLVSEETVRTVGEQLMIQNPRYWLAPVLVAMGAWASDEPELCERAITEANRRSPTHTALFMALVLRRQGRRDASVRWLRQYLAALDPNALGRDFAVILECIAQGAFGPGGLDLVQERLEAWREQLLNDEAKHQAQVDRWRVEMDRHRAASAAGTYPCLAQVSPQWPAMDSTLAAARAHGSLISTYRALADEEITGRERLEDAVDDILDRLVKEYDDEELPLRREHALNQAIIRHRGDMGASQKDLATDLAALEITLDYLTIQSLSALDPAKIGVSRSTQRIAVASCHEWFTRAHGLFCRDYRAELPSDVQAVFQGNHNMLGRPFNLAPWTGSFTQPMDELERSLGAHWDRAGQPFIDRFAFNWAKQVIAPIVATVVALVVLGACLKVPGVLLALLGGGIWFGVLYMRSQSALQKQQEVRNQIAKARHDSITQLRAAGAELTDWSSQFRSADSMEPAVRTLIADLATAGTAPSPYERRVAAVGPADRSMR